MRYIQNEKGIALVMVLIFSLIGLAIVSAMLFMLTQGTLMSGTNKMFRSADEAGLAGVNVAVDMVQNRGVPSLGTLAFGPLTGDACLSDKLTIGRGTGAPSALTPWLNCYAQLQGTLAGQPQADRFAYDPTINPDITRLLAGPGTTFTAQAKIIDTVQGNTDVSGLVGSGQLGGAGVVAASGGQVSPPAVPYLYRIEVQTQNNNNPAEVSRYSVLYAY